MEMRDHYMASARHFGRRIIDKAVHPYVNTLVDHIDAVAAGSATAQPSGEVGDEGSSEPVQFAELAYEDFSALLHELRTVELARMPRGVTLLSAGCAGNWYLDWIDGAYGRVTKHVGVEAYSPKPHPLPDWFEWHEADVANMPDVQDHSVDVAFSGQNFEHLFEDQLVGFLAEANRVLRPGGHLVVDSPNRTITAHFTWLHPEHVAEFEPDEAVALLEAAGFGSVTIRGLWVCRDQDRWISPFSSEDLLKRTILATDRPSDSFVWWAEASKASEVDHDRLRAAVRGLYGPARAERLSRTWVLRPDLSDSRTESLRVPEGDSSQMLEGPSCAVEPGRYEISVGMIGGSEEGVLLRLEVWHRLPGGDSRVKSGDVLLEATEGAVVHEVDVATVTFDFTVKVFGIGRRVQLEPAIRVRRIGNRDSD